MFVDQVALNRITQRIIWSNTDCRAARCREWCELCFGRYPPWIGHPATAVQFLAIAIQIANILHSNGEETSPQGMNRCPQKGPT